MSGIIEFIKTVSAAAVIMAAVYILGFKGKMEKSFKYALGLFSVAVIIFGAVNIVNDDFIPFEGGLETEMIASGKSINDVNLAYILEELLHKNNIAFEKIEVDTDILEDGSINITKAAVKCSGEKDFQKAYQLILKETGIQITEG